METKIRYIIKNDSQNYFGGGNIVHEYKGTLKTTYKFTHDISKAKMYSKPLEALAKAEEINALFDRYKSLNVSPGKYYVMKVSISELHEI